MNIYKIEPNTIYFPYCANNFNKNLEDDIGIAKMEEMAKSSDFIVEKREIYNRIFKVSNTSVALLVNSTDKSLKAFAITNTIKKEVIFLDLIVLKSEVRNKTIGERLIKKILEEENFSGKWLAIREWGTNLGFFNFIKKFGEFVDEETIPHNLVEETKRFKPEYEKVYWIKLNSS